jgi:hypothetical protein
MDSTIITLNNRGAASLISGDLENALCALSEALHYSNKDMNQSVAGGESSAPTTQAPFNIGTLMEHKFVVQDDDGDEVMAVDGNGAEPSASDSLSSFVYLNPIVIPDGNTTQSSGAQGKTVLSSIVIFNVALCHHSLALQQPSQTAVNADTRLLLLKARKLYELAIRLHQGSVRALGLSCSKLYILSCMNNLGHVHHLLGDDVASRKCFQQLLSTLMYLSYSSTKTAESTLNYAPFFKNIFHNYRTVAPAA